MMKKFKENVWSDRFTNLGFIFLLLFVITIVLTIVFNSLFLICIDIIVILLSFTFLMLGAMKSNISKYSKEFINYYENKVKNVTDINEIKKLYNEIYDLAIKDNFIFLRPAYKIRNMLNDLESKYEILLKLKKL